MRTAEKKKEQVCNHLQKDSRITVTVLVGVMGISKSTCHAILPEDLGKRKRNARLILRILTDDQKVASSSTGSDLLETAAENPEF